MLLSSGRSSQAGAAGREHWRSSFAGFNNDTAMNREQQHARSERGQNKRLADSFRPGQSKRGVVAVSHDKYYFG